MFNFIDFDLFETSLGVKIPHELRILNFIDLGKEKEIVTSNSRLNINNFIYSSDNIEHWDEDIIIDSFIENKNLSYYWLGRSKGDLWEENERFLGIAKLNNPIQSFIVFSVNEKDFGSIWVEFPDYIEINGIQEERILIEDNFISFLSKLKRGYYKESIEQYLPLEKNLYKNWGEDFWRVRKEKDKT